jgi:RND family efflux transporter MFP subunit
VAPVSHASLAVSVALCLSFACGGNAGRGGPAASGPPPTLVKAAEVRLSNVEDASEFVASVQSLSSTAIKPEVSGLITRILVRSGDRVAQGAPLFVIDPRRQEATVTTQSASLAAQEAAATFANQQVERARALYKEHAISQQELQQAQSNADAAREQLEAQRARVQQERVTLQYYEVRAPAPGVVGDIPVRLGARVTTDTQLTTVDRNEHLEVYVPIPLEHVPDVRMGLPIDLLDGKGQRIARTAVSFISPRVDDQTQSVLVKGRLDDAAGLRSAQFVRARIVWNSRQGITVPLLAVVRINGQPFVFVIKNAQGRATAEQRLIQVGDIVGNDIAVLRGLSPGERIVVSGVQKLANGVPVRVE